MGPLGSLLFVHKMHLLLWAASDVVSALALVGGSTSGRATPANLNLLGSFDTNSCTVAPGVTYTRIERGEQSRKDFYTVDVAFETDLAAAKAAAKELSAEGYEPMIEKISERAPDDPQNGPLGYLVRVGSFATRAEADTLRAELTEEGYTGLRTVYIGEDGSDTSGPWVVHVLEIDPDLYDGTVTPVLATGIVPERELLSSISDGTDSLAAINLAYLSRLKRADERTRTADLLITSWLAAILERTTPYRYVAISPPPCARR